MRRWLKAAGTAELSVTGADLERFLAGLSQAEVPFRSLGMTDPLTLRLQVPARAVSQVRQCAGRAMCEVTALRISGAAPMLRAMGPRLLYPPVLLAVAALVFWLQGHVWFITVTGNETVPTERILWTLEDQGVGFWTRWEDLDLNTVKNRTLAALPELGWITVNQTGGTAEVVVREREDKPVLSQRAGPAHIVARRGGLITAVTAENGAAQVKPGDTVQAGDVLISGTEDLEWTTLLTRAAGEVYARTWTQVAAVLPDNTREKAYTGRTRTLWSLTAGKKTINFFKTSGISYINYDTITERTALALPGGYSFPVFFTKTTLREYLPQEAEADPALLEQAVLRQLRLEMTAGQLLETAFRLREVPGGGVLTGTAECREEIGRTTEITDE